MDRNQQAVVTNERVHVPPCRFCCILMPTHRSNNLSRSHHSSSSSSSLPLRSFANLFVQQFFFKRTTTLDTLRASAQDLSTDQPIHGSFTRPEVIPPTGRGNFVLYLPKDARSQACMEANRRYKHLQALRQSLLRYAQESQHRSCLRDEPRHLLPQAET